MTELDRPLKHLLREREVPIDALWARIEGKRSSPLSGFVSAAPTASWARIAGFAGALGAVFVLAALAVVLIVPRAQLGWLGAKPGEGAITRANGDMLSVLDTSSSDAALDVALSDGSSIHLNPRAKLVTERSDSQQFRAAVQHGRVTFDVKPHGARRWIIDAGDTQVTVVGTRFSVERGESDDARVTVAVERGRVEVRGPRVPQGMLAMGQGEKLSLRQPSAASAPEQAAPAGDASDAPSHAGEAAASASPRERTSDGVARLGETTADQLLKASDTARARADYRRAAHTLQRFLSLYPDDSRAAIVALTLGRIQLDQLALPKVAAISLARADRVGLPDAVAEEGAARLVEAYAKSGQKELARAAAARYGRRFSDGPRSASVTAWLNSN